MNAEALTAQWTNVHGIDAAPVEDKVDGYPRKVWRRDGVDVIESYTITGMAHGTPLATGAHGGTAGPFLARSRNLVVLSHREVLRPDRRSACERSAQPEGSAWRAPLVPDEIEIIPDERVEILEPKSDKPKFDEAPRGAVDVMAIITKALTSAGLMKPPA